MASSQKSAEYCAQLVREIEELHATIDRRNKEIAESIRHLQQPDGLRMSLGDLVAVTNTNASKVAQLNELMAELKDILATGNFSVNYEALERQTTHLSEHFNEVKVVLVGSSQIIEDPGDTDSLVDQMDDVLDGQKDPKFDPRWFAPVIGAVVGSIIFGPAGFLLGFKGGMTLAAISVAGAGIGAGLGKAGDEIVKKTGTKKTH